MKILILSLCGGETALGWRLVKEGHQVKMWIKESGAGGAGFVPMVKSWEEHKPWADFVVVNGDLAEMAPALRREKKSVFGGPVEFSGGKAEGVKVHVSGFFNGKDFVEPISIGLKETALMPGDIGPDVGEMGTSSVWLAKRKVYAETLAKVSDTLKSQHYAGYVDLCCAFTKESVTILDLSTNFERPIAALETIQGNLGEWMFKIARGEPANFKISNPYCVSVSLWRWGVADPGITFKIKDRTGIWPADASRDKEGKWSVAGSSQYPLVVAGQGASIKECQEMAYKRAESVSVSGSFYRNDIGASAEEALEKLNGWGWFGR